MSSLKILATVVGGPRCSDTSDTGCDIVLWYQYNVDGIVGWNTDCDPVYWQNLFGQNATQSQPTLTINVTELEPDFTSPQVCEGSAQLRVYETYRVAELCEAIPEDDYVDAILEIFNLAVDSTNCWLSIQKAIANGIPYPPNLIIPVPASDFLDNCYPVGTDLTDIFNQLKDQISSEPQVAPVPVNNPSNIFQQIWNWLKSLFD